MKKSLAGVKLPLVAAAVLLTGAALFAGGKKDSAAETQKVIYAATGGSPRPFTYVDDSGKLVGHNIELVQAIFERLPQYKLEIEVTEFPSIFAGLDSDRYQLGVNNFALNDERRQKYVFSDPMFKNRYVAVVSASNTVLGDQVKTLRDLAGRTTENSVGINVATAIENYNKANPNAQIKQSYTEANMQLLLQHVEEGLFEFNLIDKPMFEVYQKEFNFKVKGLELSDEVSGDIMQSPFSYLLISKGNEQLAADINAALTAVIKDGTSKRINEKYFGSDYSPDVK
jgi:polar amino acid transport system substrate-binding protein